MPKTKKTAKDAHRSSTSKPSKKRLRVQTSADEFLPDSDEEIEVGPTTSKPGRSDGARPKGRVKFPEMGEKSKTEVEIRKIKQKLRRTEAEKKKFEEKLTNKRSQLGQEREKVSIAERKIEKLKKDSSKLKKTNEKLVKEKEDVLKESKEDNAKWRKKVDSLKQKTAGLELERAKLESKLSSLTLGGDPEAGPSRGGAGGPGLFQDMMDNFRELAETQLQCAVCSELFVEATSINCGHTFCNYCITEWMKKKANCPVCRTDIKQSVQCKVLDEYADKLYDQFVGEGGKLQRQTLKEERSKIKKENEAANAARAQERRERHQARRNNDDLEMVNIVLNSRARRNDDDDSSLDSDATLELHLSDGGGQLSEPDFDTDSSLSVAYDDPSSDFNISSNNISDLWNNSRFDSDTDSSDEEFQTHPHNDTDSVSDSSESDSSPSSSDTSSDDTDSDF